MFTPHHVSHIRCQVLFVTCDVSGVRCQVSGVIIIIFFIFFLQIGGASQWRVCYQRGLPRLVSIHTGCVLILPNMQDMSVFFLTDRMCLYSFLDIEFVCCLSNNLTYMICVIYFLYFLLYLNFLHALQ